MTKDEVTRMAHEAAGFDGTTSLERPVVLYAAMSKDFLDKFASLVAAAELRRLHAVNAELLEALRDGLSACSSVSTSIDRRVVRDGCISYLQTEEWCKWLENEVEPKLRTAIAKANGGVV